MNAAASKSFPPGSGDCTGPRRGNRIAGQGGLGGRETWAAVGRLAEVSKAAFVTAMHASLTVLAVIVAVSAVLIVLWAPGRDGQQLRLVRRIVSSR